MALMKSDLTEDTEEDALDSALAELAGALAGAGAGTVSSAGEAADAGNISAGAGAGTAVDTADDPVVQGSAADTADQPVVQGAAVNTASTPVVQTTTTTTEKPSGTGNGTGTPPPKPIDPPGQAKKAQMDENTAAATPEEDAERAAKAEDERKKKAQQGLAIAGMSPYQNPYAGVQDTFDAARAMEATGIPTSDPTKPAADKAFDPIKGLFDFGATFVGNSGIKLGADALGAGDIMEGNLLTATFNNERGHGIGLDNARTGQGVNLTNRTQGETLQDFGKATSAGLAGLGVNAERMANVDAANDYRDTASLAAGQEYKGDEGDINRLVQDRYGTQTGTDVEYGFQNNDTLTKAGTDATNAAKGTMTAKVNQANAQADQAIDNANTQARAALGGIANEAVPALAGLATDLWNGITGWFSDPSGGGGSDYVAPESTSEVAPQESAPSSQGAPGVTAYKPEAPKATAAPATPEAKPKYLVDYKYDAAVDEERKRRERLRRA